MGAANSNKEFPEILRVAGQKQHIIIVNYRISAEDIKVEMPPMQDSKTN